MLLEQLTRGVGNYETGSYTQRSAGVRVTASTPLTCARAFDDVITDERKSILSVESEGRQLIRLGLDWKRSEWNYELELDSLVLSLQRLDILQQLHTHILFHGTRESRRFQNRCTGPMIPL
jgi:hypothetical protein